MALEFIQTSWLKYGDVNFDAMFSHISVKFKEEKKKKTISTKYIIAKFLAPAVC